MPSDLLDLNVQQQDQPSLEPPHPITETIRTKLLDLDFTAHSLKVEKAGLERQLRVVIEKILANDTQIRHTMDSLGHQLFRDQRAERQCLFVTSLLDNENLIEGMFYQMQANPQLMRAISAVVKEEGTLHDNTLIAGAIMTELTGNTFQFGHDVAARVIELERARNEAMAGLAAPSTNMGQDSLNAAASVIDPALATAAAEAARETSVIALRGNSESTPVSLISPSVKSEPTSIATPYTVEKHLPGLPAPAVRSKPNNATPSIETPSVARLPQANIVAHGMSSLQRSFPGLLESIAPGPATTRARPGRAAPSSVPAKRSRAPTEEASPSPPVTRAGKKSRVDKEPAISHTFINYMKHLEQLHRSSKSIMNIIRCSRCSQVKREVRVLNCLHMYCHRCVLQLRGQAQHGDAITGFNSTCVQTGCTQVVSGKTTVIDAEIIDFLRWYDQQSPAITTLPCQLHALTMAVAKFPKDDGIQAKLQQVQNQVIAMQTSAYGDQLVDLMEMAKLIRKPYIN